MNEQDENILGQAVRRAVESQGVRETPFHRSRLAAELERQPVRFSLWQFAAAAAALVLAVGAGLYLANRAPIPPATEPSPTPSPTESPAATPLPGRLDRQVVYFARDLLPPRAQHVDGAGVANTPAERILSRLRALETATPTRAGDANVVRDGIARVASVSVDGDLATVDYDVPGGNWGVDGSANLDGFEEQIVYTASEEPGIRRVLITQNGGQEAVIGGEGLTVDEPQTREGVFDYAQPGAPDLDSGGGVGASGGSTFDEDVESSFAGLTRVTVGFERPPEGDLTRYTATLRQNDESRDPDRAKWVLALEVPGVQGSTVNMQQVDANTWVQVIDQTPLRAVFLVRTGSGSRYEFALDDARPWRVVFLPGPARLAVDIGGYPDAVRGDDAVYAPVPGSTVSRTFTLSGAARAFEANVQWRVKNSSGQVVASGFTTATIGTSSTWGAFETTVSLPASVSGGVTLEVFQSSPRDGSDLHVVSYGIVVQ